MINKETKELFLISKRISSQSKLQNGQIKLCITNKKFKNYLSYLMYANLWSFFGVPSKELSSLDGSH